MEVLARLFIITFLMFFVNSSYVHASPVHSSAKYNAYFVYKAISKELNNSGGILCVIGDDPIMPHISRVFKIKSRIKVKRRYVNDNLSSCDIVYIGKTYSYIADRIINKTENNNALTIANMKGFVNFGGIIEFNTLSSGVEVTVNYNKLSDVKLKVNEQVVSMAEMIELRR